MTNKVKAALQDLDRLMDSDLPESERKVRLSVLKERLRIEGVYDLAKQTTQDESADEREESEVLAQIRQHLEPLGLAPEGTALPELARLAALKITEK